MSNLTLHYSTFNESYWERFFTRVLSTPTIGSIVSAFFYKKIISSYTNLLLEIAGFQEYTSELDAKSATLFIKRFTKIKHLMSALQANILKRKTVSDEELLSIIAKIIDKVSENIALLEDIAKPHFSYQISTSATDNDWNDSLNDHWDNY